MTEMIVQSPDEVVAFLKALHNLIEDMFDEVLHASNPQAREKPFVALRQLLAVRETAEEMIVHPRVRREADAGDIVDARLQEEHEATELLSLIEKLDVTSPEFIDQVKSYGRPYSTMPSTRKAKNSRRCSGKSTKTTSSAWVQRCVRPRPSRRPARIRGWNRRS